MSWVDLIISSCKRDLFNDLNVETRELLLEFEHALLEIFLGTLFCLVYRFVVHVSYHRLSFCCC